MKWIWLNVGLISTAAMAGDWSDYDSAFSPIVCSDGLVGCVVDGEHIDIDTISDSEGRFHPADLRINFFTFEAMPTMSPFSELSVYEERKEQAAVVEPEPVQQPANVAVRPSSTTPEPAIQPEPEEQPEPDAAPYVPVAVQTQEATTRPTDNRGVRPPIPGQTNSPPPQPISQPEPEPEPIPVAEPEPDPEPEPAPVEQAPPIPQAPVVANNQQQQGCANLTQFETNAMMGTLNVGSRQCLDTRASDKSEPVTVRARASILLITDAQTRGDAKEWERLVKRHLQNIEKSQPDMCLSYAGYLFNKGPSRARQVIKWAEVALTNKHLWSGDARVTKVNSLYQLRAFAANSLWELNEQKLVKERTTENQDAVDQWRGQTKNFSREWLDFARAAGSDTSSALQLCVSAAGDMDFCQD